jgi:predicted anti-sigma-YlaC factor YlaD
MFAAHRQNIVAVDEGDAAAFAAGVVELYTSRPLWETVKISIVALVISKQRQVWPSVVLG